MGGRDEAAEEAGRTEAMETYEAEITEAARAALTGEDIARRFGARLRGVVGRSPSNRDWRAFTTAAQAQLDTLMAAEAKRAASAE